MSSRFRTGHSAGSCALFVLRIHTLTQVECSSRGLGPNPWPGHVFDPYLWSTHLAVSPARSVLPVRILSPVERCARSRTRVGEAPLASEARSDATLLLSSRPRTAARVESPDRVARLHRVLVQPSGGGWVLGYRADAAKRPRGAFRSRFALIHLIQSRDRFEARPDSLC
jgi:hypothetical protein